MASTPLYLQIAQQLAGDIGSGVHPVGSCLPTEAKLCASYDISRSTAREALRCLVDRGMIQRMPRIGSQVIAAVPVNRYQPIASTAGDLVKLATGTQIRGGESRFLEADAGLAQRIGCSLGAELFVFEGARFLRGSDNRPLCWSEQYIPAYFPEGARRALLESSFTADAADKARVEQLVTAIVMDEAMAQHLDSQCGSAALVITRRHTHADGTFYAGGIHTHPADRFELHLSVTTAVATSMEA